MKKINAILEAGKDGYGVWFEEIPNVFAFGETIELAQEDAFSVISHFVEFLNDYKKPIPKILQGEYEIEFRFDTVALLAHLDGVITKAALSKASGINQSQLSHYSKGIKKPRKEQQDKIINGICKLGNELLSVANLKTLPKS